MKSNDARDLMVKLLDAGREKDEAFVAGHNLPSTTLFLLRKLVGIGLEISSLERMLERREQEEALTERALQVELEKLP